MLKNNKYMLKKMERNLTGDKNIDSMILENLGDRDLFKICKISKYGNELCKYEPLWYKRLMNKFPDLLQYKNTDMSFKNYYISLVRTMSEILEKQKSEDADYYYDYYDDNMDMDINQWKLIYLDKDMALRIAFKNENTSLIKYLWEKKIIRTFSEYYLYASAKRGDLDFLSFLLKNGNFEDIRYEDLMSDAAQNGQLEILKFLERESPEEFKKVRMTFAVDHIEILKFFVNKKNKELEESEGKGNNDIFYSFADALEEAAKNGKLESVKYIVENAKVNTNDLIHYEADKTMEYASFSGNTEIVKYLLEKGADIDAREGGPLEVAVENGHLEMVKFLVQRGAKINLGNALAMAVEDKYYEIAKYLIKEGADLNAALKYAVKKEKLGMVKYLIGEGADANVENGGLLRDAILEGSQSIAMYLIENGANIHDDRTLEYIFQSRRQQTLNIPLLLKILLDKGFDKKRALEIAIKDTYRGKEFTQFIENIEDDYDILADAVIMENSALIEYLLKKGLDKNTVLKIAEKYDMAIANEIIKKHYNL